MKELEIQKLLRKDGLKKTIEHLSLICKEKDNLILLKYRQIDADWRIEATHECRGIILDKDNNFEVVSYPYKKFFNLGEGYCADIDWNTAEVYEKSDGSLMNCYYYNNKWNVQTSGIPDATGETYIGKTFQELFYDTVKINYGSVEEFESKLNTNYNYMFELCTPYNIICVPHKEHKLLLHGVRDMRTFDYVSIDDIDLIKVKKYDINSIEQIENLMKDMDWTEEGFVVVDANFNRAKIKNPSFVAVHHTATKSSPYSIVNVIKENEIDEFLTYFKHHTEEINTLKIKWDNLIIEIEDLYNTIKDIKDIKEFALEVQKMNKKYQGIMFSLRTGKIKSVHEGLSRFHNRDLYNKYLGMSDV